VERACAVASALLALPAVLVPALAALLDLDLVGFAATAAGRGVVVLAGGLLVLGAACALLLLRHAHRGLPTAGADEAVDLVAAGLAAGLAAPAALRAVGRTIPQVAGEADRVALALEFGRPPATLGPLGPLAGSLATAAMHGAPAVEAVMRLAAETRAAARAQALERAARLPVLLVFPTALFVLPAVVLLVGGPVVAEALAGLGPVGPGG
jgi:tight adherence protein C